MSINGSMVIGITGHRDLRAEDVPYLEQRVREVLLDLRTKHPDQPLVVISPLAEGADRLVARIALEVQARLVAYLPMPTAEYENDFESEASLQEFRDLLAKADRCVEIPLLPGSTDENIRGWEEPRAKQYAFMGAYMASCTNVMIAMWDGTVNHLLGGTADVVYYKLHGIPAEFQPAPHAFPFVERGMVCHIVTPRVKNPMTELEPYSIHWLGSEQQL